jgi:hypothetical protein
LNEKRERVLRTSPREKKIEFQERIYNGHCSAPFSRAFLVGSAPPSLLGSKEPTLSWNQLRSKPLNERYGLWLLKNSFPQNPQK